MKIIVLSDNRTINPELETEHGLCVYFETEEHKFLLDTGASDLFIRNAQKLNVDLSAVDYVFISHGHADHIGGLPAFLEINSKAKIILSSHTVHGEYYSKRLGLRKISIDFDFAKYAERLIFVESEMKISETVSVYKSESESYNQPRGNGNLFTKSESGDLELDGFNHELIFVAGKVKLFVFTGCAHHGVLNILQTVKDKQLGIIRWILGGFHLLDSNENATYESKAELETISDSLNKDYPLAFFITGHCTGDNSYQSLKPALEHRLIKFFAGYTIEM